MSLVTVNQKNNMVVVTFQCQEDAHEQFLAYQKLIKEKKLKRSKVDIIPWDKELILYFKTTDLATSWCQRAYKRMQEYNDVKRAETLKRLEELYRSGVKTFEPEEDISDYGEVEA